MLAKPPISLALTHYNRFEFLKEGIAQVKDDPRIGEVIISDDASTDDSFDKLLSYYSDEEKVKLFRNKCNLDCYRNKEAAVAHSENDWVILFDSDNILPPAYLDTLYALLEWEPDVIYCPDFAEPHFNYTALAEIDISARNVAQLMGRPHFATALNTCNYFFNRENYLQAWEGGVDPHTADSIFHAYNWLKKGRRMRIVKGLRYFHRIHPDSHYKKNCHKTGNFAKTVEESLLTLR